MCKPGLRSERERITPPVDWSTVGNAQGGGLSQYQSKFNTPVSIKAECSTFVSPQQLMVLKNKSTVAAVLHEYP